MSLQFVFSGGTHIISLHPAPCKCAVPGLMFRRSRPCSYSRKVRNHFLAGLILTNCIISNHKHVCEKQKSTARHKPCRQDFSWLCGSSLTVLGSLMMMLHHLCLHNLSIIEWKKRFLSGVQSNSSQSRIFPFPFDSILRCTCLYGNRFRPVFHIHYKILPQYLQIFTIHFILSRSTHIAGRTQVSLLLHICSPTHPLARTQAASNWLHPGERSHQCVASFPSAVSNSSDT